jgi:RND family efflux transporter MFP subunit
MYKIDDREASFNLKAQKAALLTAITQMMPDLKFDYPQSFEAWDTYLSSYDVNSTLKALPEPQSDSEKYFVAGRNIYSQYYNIKSLETRLSEYSIYAPFSGVLTSVNIDPGGMAMPGNTLATMINTSSYEYITTVPYESLSYIKPGQKVDLYVNEEGQNWTGTVSRIGTQIDPNTQNFPLYITVMGKELKDGMYLKGTLEGKALEGIVTLPKTTLVDANHVFVVDDSTLVRKTVEPVKRTKDHVLIRGLTSDDQVVVSSLAGLFEGQKVNY